MQNSGSKATAILPKSGTCLLKNKGLSGFARKKNAAQNGIKNSRKTMGKPVFILPGIKPEYLKIFYINLLQYSCVQGIIISKRGAGAFKASFVSVRFNSRTLLAK